MTLACTATLLGCWRNSTPAQQDFAASSKQRRQRRTRLAASSPRACPTLSRGYLSRVSRAFQSGKLTRPGTLIRSDPQEYLTPSSLYLSHPPSSRLYLPHIYNMSSSGEDTPGARVDGKGSYTREQVNEATVPAEKDAGQGTHGSGKKFTAVSIV